MNTVTVKINGMEYNLKGKEDDEYLLRVSEYVDSKFKEISSNNNKLSISSVAVLSALNIADELFKCDKEIEDLLGKKNYLEEKNLTLKERIKRIKQEVEEAFENKNQELASLKEMLYVMEQKSRKAEILSDRVADLMEELEEKNKLEEKVEILKENMIALQKENQNLCKKIDVLEYNLVTSEKNNKKLNRTILNAQDELLKKQKENDNLNLKILKLNEEIDNKVSLEAYNNVLDNYNASKEKIKQISLEKSKIENMLEEFKININYIELENRNLKNNEDVLKEAISLKEDEIEEYKTKSYADEKEAVILKDKIVELEAEIARGKEQRKALLNRDKDIKFQLQNFKYKVLDLEKKLIDVQVELVSERRKSNPLLK